MDKLTVCWLSGGVSSFVAGYLMKEEIDRFIYCHIDDQHSDTLRFIKDCEAALAKPVTILQSPYKSVGNVIRTFQFVNSRYGARCTGILKRRLRKEFEQANKEVGLTYVWGFDCTEKNRIERTISENQKQNHRFPLFERNISKEDAHGVLKMLGIKRPTMYDLGYRNNNCIGCVKGGMGYWNRIRVDFPEVFAERAKQERDIGYSCINGIFLDELDPSAGQLENEILEDCGIMCQIAVRG